jgi:phosphoglycerate dehydrogenase-like enzyme
MNALRVLATKNFCEDDVAHLRAGLNPAVELVMPPAFTVDAVADAVQDKVHVLLGEMITKEILDNGRHLRLIQIPWTGVDRLNFSVLRQYNLPVCNSHSNATIVAEMAVGLMLAIVKKIPFHDAHLRQGQWMRPRNGVAHVHSPPALLSGKTVGFIGYGAIARKIVKLLSGFELTFLATVTQPKQPPPAPLTAIYPPEAQNEIARQSDVVFVAAPLVPGTRGLVDSQFFAQMRPTAYLINTSRGEIVDEQALYTALQSRQIAGAAIDTWYQYPTPSKPDVLPSANFPFHELDNIVVSPHRAGYVEGDLPHLADVIDNLNRLAAGQPLINRIDLTKGF